MVMNAERLEELFKGTDNFSDNDIAQLGFLTKQYPYFAKPHIVLARALYLSGSEDFDYSLKKAAIRTSDREWLFDFVQAPPRKSTTLSINEAASEVVENIYNNASDVFNPTGTTEINEVTEVETVEGINIFDSISDVVEATVSNKYIIPDNPEVPEFIQEKEIPDIDDRTIESFLKTEDDAETSLIENADENINSVEEISEVENFVDEKNIAGKSDEDVNSVEDAITAGINDQSIEDDNSEEVKNVEQKLSIDNFLNDETDDFQSINNSKTDELIIDDDINKEFHEELENQEINISESVVEMPHTDVEEEKSEGNINEIIETEPQQDIDIKEVRNFNEVEISDTDENENQLIENNTFDSDISAIGGSSIFRLEPGIEEGRIEETGEASGFKTSFHAVPDLDEVENQNTEPEEPYLKPEIQEDPSPHFDFFGWLEKGLANDLSEVETEKEEIHTQIEKPVSRTREKIVDEHLIEKLDEIEEKPEILQKKKNSLSIIDQFISHNPSISRSKKEFFSPENMAKRSEKLDNELVTETLANIYYTYGELDMAIDAYEKLKLQYPAKDAYFASLIQKIKLEKK